MIPSKVTLRYSLEPLIGSKIRYLWVHKLHINADSAEEALGRNLGEYDLFLHDIMKGSISGTRLARII